MKFIKENKELLIKYLLLIVSNLILYVLTSFYLKNSDYSSIVMFILIVVLGMVIYYYRGTKEFKIYLDIPWCFILGLIMMIFVKDEVYYAYYLFNMFFANNIVFMRSRKSEKFLKKLFQYFLIMLITILCMVLNLLVYYFIFV